MFIQQPKEGYRERITPLEAFEDGRKLLSVFLEDGSSYLNFQELNQSRYTLKDTSMEPTTLRCFKDMIAVIYKIGKNKTVIIYQIHEEKCGQRQR